MLILVATAARRRPASGATSPTNRLGSTNQGVNLARAFNAIKAPKLRASIVGLAEQLAQGGV